MRMKCVAQSFQLSAKFAEIVDLAVEDHPNLLVRASHRLVGRLTEVADLQPPECKADARRGCGMQFGGCPGSDNRPALIHRQKTLAIGTAMTNDRMHGQQPRDEIRRAGWIEQ